ncbi:RNA polymerase ECF-type sigma factor [hydrothermal vent metagenome]|uniref:RNA polymerase ECF-type sigma factor n=1 Tax=hydrothermal vent metagenome TaxID=652676 RepID=A0A3B0UEF9_9ZZZZ
MEERFLIQGLKTKNKIVFDFVFHYYYSGLCAYAEKIVGDANASEDIVQDLFFTLWIKHNQIDITSSLKNYLFTSVKNRSLDYLKKEKKKTQHSNSTNHLQNHSENLSTFWFAESELETLIDESLNKLPPRCREIFKLSRFEGLKNQEIAEKLGISKRTVELQISNALKRLREDLRPYLPVFLFMFLLR